MLEYLHFSPPFREAISFFFTILMNLVQIVQIVILQTRTLFHLNQKFSLMRIRLHEDNFVYLSFSTLKYNNKLKRMRVKLSFIIIA